MNFIKSWIYSDLMEIRFCTNQRKKEKENVCGMIWTWDLWITRVTLKQARLVGIYKSCLSIWSTIVTLIVLKICQSRAITDKFCQDEGFELTCYIETLIWAQPLMPRGHEEEQGEQRVRRPQSQIRLQWTKNRAVLMKVTLTLLGYTYQLLGFLIRDHLFIMKSRGINGWIG